MAKQNVTFIERHVEKVVIGIAGAALLGIAVLYLISTPHTVEVDGASFGPERFYAHLSEKAEQARSRMKSARPDRDASDNELSDDMTNIDAQGSPYDNQKIPKEFARTFAALGLAVPEVRGGPVRGQVRLADILPPKPILVTSGRAFVKLNDPKTIIPGDRSAGANTEQFGITKDHHWVTVFAAVHRKEQREQFSQAHYELNRQRLIVAAVEAERQQLMPDGKWGESVLVSGYSPEVIPVHSRVELVKQDDGDYPVLYTSDSDYVGQYRALLETQDRQAQILRPAFQEFLKCPQYDWLCPRKLPDLEIDMGEYCDLPPTDEESDESGRGRDPLTGSTDIGRSSRAQLKRLTGEAEEAIENGEYIEAGELLKQIAEHPDATQTEVDNARLELRKIQPNIDQALIEQRREEKKQADASKQQLGEDVEPLWLNDNGVTPNATYRYRLRLLAYNPYVGVAFKLENPEDAGKVVTVGKWSEWSEPIQVAPVQYLFLASTKDGPRRAKLEMREWELGGWHAGRQEIGVGEPLAFNDRGRDYVYNAIVVDVSGGVNYEERSVNRSGEISYREKPTAAMVLITSDGEVEERIAAVDSRLKRNLIDEIRKDGKRRVGCEDMDHRRPREMRSPVTPDRPLYDEPLGGEPEDELLRGLR